MSSEHRDEFSKRGRRIGGVVGVALAVATVAALTAAVLPNPYRDAACFGGR